MIDEGVIPPLLIAGGGAVALVMVSGAVPEPTLVVTVTVRAPKVAFEASVYSTLIWFAET